MSVPRERLQAAAWPWLRRAAAGLLLYLAVAAAAVAVSALVVLASGHTPGPALAALARGAAGSRDGAANSLAQAIPLMFTGLALAVAFRGGVWNIGAEGQFLVGMLAATAVALRVGALPPFLATSLALVAGAAAGMAWSAGPALLRLFRGVPEVISTIMLNFVAAYLVSACVQGPLHAPGTDIPETAVLPQASWLPVLARGTDVHAGLLVALGLAVVLHLVIGRTAFGLELRAMGASAEAARAAGVPVRRVVLAAFLASGAIAGLGGAAHALGSARQLFVYEPGDPGYGYSGIAVALLGRQSAGGAVAAALFFGALAAGSSAMQRNAGVYVQLAYVIQALSIFALLTLRSEIRNPKSEA